MEATWMICQSPWSLGFTLTVTYHFFLKEIPVEPAYLPELKLCLLLLVETVSQCCVELLDVASFNTGVQTGPVHTTHQKVPQCNYFDMSRRVIFSG